MNPIRLFFATLSRFFMSAVFIAGAVKNILDWHETEKSILTVLVEWQTYVDFSQSAHEILSFFIPWVSVLQLGATFVLLLGGLLLLLGSREKWAASLLLLVLIPATVLCHPFWWIEGPARDLQMVMFLKNLSLIGFLIHMLSSAPAAFKIGNRFDSSSFS